MKPLTWRHATDGNMPTAQNFLSDQRHQDGMIDVVVGSVGISDIFKREPPDETDYAGKTRLKHPVGPFILALKLANKCFNNNLRGIKHRRHLRLGGAVARKFNAPLRSGCCAHAAAPPPSSVMNSRRFQSRKCMDNRQPGPARRIHERTGLVSSLGAGPPRHGVPRAPVAPISYSAETAASPGRRRPRFPAVQRHSISVRGAHRI